MSCDETMDNGLVWNGTERTETDFDEKDHPEMRYCSKSQVSS
jgi:hypothetical protein